VELLPSGYVATPQPWRTATTVDGVFAAGDVIDDSYPLPPYCMNERAASHAVRVRYPRTVTRARCRYIRLAA